MEAWDPRTRGRVGVLDSAIHSVTEDREVTSVPAVTCLQFRDGLQLGVGTSTGKVWNIRKYAFDKNLHEPDLWVPLLMSK